MQTYRAFIGFILLACGLSVAAAQQRDGAVPNNLFTASGFIVKYATTPEKRAILRSLPPDKLVKRTKEGRLYYVYADAVGCNCAYVGTPQAYAAYQNSGNDPSYSGDNQISNDMQIVEGGDAADIAPIDNVLDPDF